MGASKNTRSCFDRPSTNGYLLTYNNGRSH